MKVRVAISSGGTAVIEELLVDGLPFDPKTRAGVSFQGAARASPAGAGAAARTVRQGGE